MSSDLKLNPYKKRDKVRITQKNDQILTLYERGYVVHTKMIG